MLVDYADKRLQLAQLHDADARQELAHNDDLASRLWIATVAVWPTIRGLDVSSSYIDSMNTVIALDESQKISRQAKVPDQVYLVPFVYVTATASLAGYTRDRCVNACRRL